MPAIEGINFTTQSSLTDATATNSAITNEAIFAPQNIVTSKDPFWYYASIDPTRWNQNWPYQLLILNAQSGSGGFGDPVASFTLPIPPQELGVGTPFAISVAATLGGIVEQHNGIVFKDITLSSTTGVWPGRSSSTPFVGPNVAQAIIAGTINAVNAFTGQGNVEPNVSFASTFPSTPGAETGYYQMLLLEQFLESYVTAKKTDGGRTLRLALAIWKEKAVYLVTPVKLDKHRTSSSPWEYMYSLQLRAWKRIQYSGNGVTAVNSGATASIVNTQAVQQLIESVANAQQQLQVQNIVSLLQSWPGALGVGVFLEDLRSLQAWGKDSIGQNYTVADMPDQIILGLYGAVITACSDPSTAPVGVDPDFLQLLLGLGSTSGKAQTGAGNPTSKTTTSLSGHLRTSTVPHTANQNLSRLYGPNAADPLNTIFTNPKQFFQYFSSINLADLQIPPTVQAKITAERNRVRGFTRTTFANTLASIQATAENYADFCGAGDPTFNITFNRTPIPATRTPSDNDFQLLFNLNAVVMQLNRFAAYNNLTAIPTNPMDFAAGFFAGTDIPFQSYPGKFLIPFPYGATFEMLAQQYLGSPDRWQEITTLNNLREPYVDETGFTVPLLTNGNGAQITVGSVDNLEVNQLVYLYAGGQPRISRHILSITPIDGGSYYLLVLDGAPNLGTYTLAQGAYLQAYLPGTVNSQMSLYIPSKTVPPVPEYDTPGIPGLNPFQQWFNIGGVDLLLTSTGNLVVTPDGDCRLAIGITNVVQSAWLAFNTPKGSLQRHKDYGFPKLVGQSIADNPASTILSAAKGLFNGDPTFTGVQSASVNVDGPVARINVGVGVAGMTNVLPISFNLR